MKPKSKKLKKPRPFEVGKINGVGILIGARYPKLKQLQTWLTRAITYVEQTKE